MTDPTATILIVDDESWNSKLLEKMLQPEGYLTRTAANGKEALVSIAERAPDLILLDAMMPGMDGYEVARRLKANPVTASIPIIMVTAQIDHNARVAGLNAGAEDFLTKPVDQAELCLRVRNLLRLKAYGDFLKNHNLILDQELQARTADLHLFHTAMDASDDAIFLVNRSTMRIVQANTTACTLLGYAREELLALDPWAVLSIPRAELERTYDMVITSGVHAKPLEMLWRRKDGSQVWVELRHHAQRLKDHWIVVKLVRDVTERRAADAKIQRQASLFAALSQCNHAIARCSSEEELFPQICRAAVQLGGMKMAWIGFTDAETLTVRPAASFGDGVEYLRDIEISADIDSPFGRGPTGVAIRENHPFWCQDFLNDPVTVPWHEPAVRYGCAASASLPLHRNGAVIGAFTLYSGGVNAFDESARDLLVEMAADVSFALDNFARESQRKRAEEALARESHRNEVFLRNASDGVHILDTDGKVLEVSDSFCQMLGYSREELIGANVSLWDAQWSAQELKKKIAEQMAAERRSILQTQHRRRDGSLFDVEITGRPLELEGKPVLFNSARDITERKAGELALTRTSRALRTLSACNAALIGAVSEPELLDTVCRLIVDAGGYTMAWVGFAEQSPEKRVRVVAQYGSTKDYLGSMHMTWTDAEQGRGPTGVAIRTGATQVHQSLMDDSDKSPWRVAALAQGFQSSVALPLKGPSGTLGALTLYGRERDAFTRDEVHLLEELADDLAFGITTLRTRAERDSMADAQLHHAEILRKSLEDSIRAIADTVEMRDPYTAGHQKRVAQLAVAIASDLGLPKDEIHGIQLAAGIHDLGKIRVPAEILSKPGKLTDIEFMLIKAHAQAGYDILKGIQFPWPIANIVLQHHERLDGSGYPQGLKGDEILLGSRILAVADVLEAMASHRPYRPSLGIDVALAEIERGGGTAFDPAVVDACLKLFREGRFAFQV